MTSTDTGTGRAPARQEAVLAALAAGVLGPAFDPAVPGRVLELLSRTASRRDRDRLLGVLGALDSRAGALVLTGRPAPLSGRPAAAAEALVRRWADSRLPPTRRLAEAVAPLALLAAYAWPGPARDATGYPGPLGPAPDVPRRLSPLRPDGDTELACDVVVVGSGAGGGVVAAELARAGLDVVVLEKGGYAAERDFTHQEGDAYRDLYLYGLTLTTDDLGCRILAGSTLGGGTVVNYTTSFATPPAVLAEWAKVSGVDAFVSGEVEASLAAVAGRLGVTEDESRPGARDRLLEQGLARLGWHSGPLPRNVRGCAQDAGCGWCGFGCRLGAKQSTLVTYLEEAAAAGARLVVGADARRVVVADGRAAGVEALAGGHRLRVRARAVVAAAGAVETPALLLRSGLGSQVGRNLRLHPGTAAVGRFEEPVHWWEGTLQARYSAQLRERLGPYAPMLETVPVHPGTAAVALPWESAAAHRALMERSDRLSLVGVLCRDRGAGRVRVDRDGSPRVRWRLDPADEAGLAAGLAAAGEVLAAAGAVEVFSLHRQRLAFRPDAAGGHRAWAAATRRAGFAGGRVTLASYHQMGSCRIGSDPATSAVGPDHQAHELAGLYVADASLFPTASGVNPMVSVMALARRAAGRVAAALA
ncbi:MAG TPA: GMC family oxidoreductase N-terminal domain-containing protein [Actinomycetes bacterium]|nr:GMC family oxidoreductase N-terminal domain-containing protein [Actinomycetes bacterium]